MTTTTPRQEKEAPQSPAQLWLSAVGQCSSDELLMHFTGLVHAIAGVKAAYLVAGTPASDRARLLHQTSQEERRLNPEAPLPAWRHRILLTIAQDAAELLDTAVDAHLQEYSHPSDTH